MRRKYAKWTNRPASGQAEIGGDVAKRSGAERFAKYCAKFPREIMTTRMLPNRTVKLSDGTFLHFTNCTVTEGRLEFALNHRPRAERGV